MIWAALSGRNHVRFEEGALQHQFVVNQGLHDGGEDVLGNLGASLDGVGAVHQDLGLDDGHKAVVLADRPVAGTAAKEVKFEF